MTIIKRRAYCVVLSVLCVEQKKSRLRRLSYEKKYDYRLISADKTSAGVRLVQADLYKHQYVFIRIVRFYYTATTKRIIKYRTTHTVHLFLKVTTASAARIKYTRLVFMIVLVLQIEIM